MLLLLPPHSLGLVILFFSIVFLLLPRPLVVLVQALHYTVLVLVSEINRCGSSSSGEEAT